MPAGVIAAVAPHSLAERLGLRAGDELLSINGHQLRDAIDVQFYAAEEHLALRVRQDGQESTLEAERRYDEPLGLEFAQPTFDGLRRCNNCCEFCFVAHMAPGLRRSLYIKDDDYRYSFLFGSYVTLTNLDEADWERIGEQGLSPLYVSVHATDPDLRRRILGNPAAPDVMAQLRRLAGMGIEIHTQIVVVPGLNDGPHLDRSIGDLSGLHSLSDRVSDPLSPSVAIRLSVSHPLTRSVSVVPVGLTRYHRGSCRVHTDVEMRAVFERVMGWQAWLREQLGVNFAYLSDEWYLRLGEEVPPLEAYDGLDLTENGVGLVRRFLENGGWRMEIGEWRMENGGWRQSPTTTLVTGTLFAPILRRVTAHVPGVEVVPVVNRFFGETVTVAGLLTGRDVVAQLRERSLGDVVVLPAAMFGGPEGQSLDEMRPQDIEKALGRPVRTAGNTADGEIHDGR